MVIAFHKPYGVLCQFTADLPGQRTLADFAFPERVYPVGRLDMDSEGLLLLTDEAGFNHRLLDPKTAHPRTYWAQVEGIADEPALQRLQLGGLDVKGHRSLPCRVRRLPAEPPIPPRDPPIRQRRQIPTSWLELVLHEGKNRQVRRMTAAVGFPTLRLMRVAVGAYELGELAPGQWQILGAADLKRVWMR